MKDGVHLITCDRPGCGRIVGAQRWENNKVVEQEWVPGHCCEDDVNDTGHIVRSRHYCSIECCNKSEEFVDPEEGANINE